MIGLDTNVLVRYLAQDDPIQSPRATELFERKLTEARPGFVSLITLAETIWVLSRTYKADSLLVADGLLVLYRSGRIIFQEEEAALTGLIALREGSMDFADAMISALNTRHGCKTTLTFDKRAARHEGFVLLV
jgi:predicted nucleic-acid-binding protein